MGERSWRDLPREVGFDLHILGEGAPVSVTSALVEPCDVVANGVRSDVLPDEHNVAGPVASGDGAVVLYILNDWAEGPRR